MFNQDRDFKFNPDLKELLADNVSRYSLVRATAKRAREISEEAEEKKIILTEKPVSIAIDEIVRGESKIIEPEEIRNI